MAGWQTPGPPTTPVAASYADQMRDALADKPYPWSALVLFAGRVRAAGGGPVADVGCGPGHVTAHLRELGVDAFGIDLSPVMVDVARRDHLGLRFEGGSMTDLDLVDAAVAGLLAWWSLVYGPDNEIRTVFEHFRRVLRPGGLLLLGHRPSQVAAWLRDADFTVEAQMLLDPARSVPGAPLSPAAA